MLKVGDNGKESCDALEYAKDGLDDLSNPAKQI